MRAVNELEEHTLYPYSVAAALPAHRIRFAIARIKTIRKEQLSPVPHPKEAAGVQTRFDL